MSENGRFGGRSRFFVKLRIVAIHDISVPIRPDMPIYAGDPDVELERASSIADGGHANVSKVSMGVHTGTHVDAPVHFLEGAPGMESVPLDALCGPAVVVDGTAIEGESISEADLEALDLPDGAERVILKTRNSELWNEADFTRDFLRLDGGGARYLIARGVRTIGIDYLSVGDHEAHRELLGAGVVPVEGLDLRKIEPGSYTLICLPLDLVGSDGAPARAILID